MIDDPTAATSVGGPRTMEAYLSQPALLAIVSSAIETFKRETIGYLVGYRGEGKFMVEYAIPYQTAESGFAHATVDMRRVERINEILKRLSENLEFVGDFHSHTAFGDSPASIKPSSEDLFTTTAGELSLVCAVNLKKRSSRWRENARGVLVGTVGEYRIEIGGHFVARPAAGSKYQRVRVKCPSATGINQG